jgi:hypothetical protein
MTVYGTGTYVTPLAPTATTFAGARVGAWIVRCEANAASIVITNGDYVWIERAFSVAVANFGSRTATRAEIEWHDIPLDQCGNPIAKFALFVYALRNVIPWNNVLVTYYH